jgi:acetyl-CoA carboxylase biotin carboxyl carrier protein
MTVDEIRELIQLASETGIAELEVQRGENRVRIRRSVGVASSQEIVVMPQAQGPMAMASAPAAVQAAAATPGVHIPAVESSKQDKGTDPNLVLVKSPIVGTFYESPSPGAPPFVRVGERVQPGKVLCIIESMKLMNEIECEVSGIVESKLVPNGQPVEYGEALFAVRCV